MVTIEKTGDIYTLMQEEHGTRKYTWMSAEEFEELCKGIEEIKKEGEQTCETCKL